MKKYVYNEIDNIESEGCCMKKTMQKMLAYLVFLAVALGAIGSTLAVFAADDRMPGEDEGLYNLSLLGSATATFYQTLSEVCPPENAIDGDVNTRWSVYGASNYTPNAIMVDLGRICSIEMLNLLWMNPARTFTYDVYVTDEPTIVDSVFSPSTEPVLKDEIGKGCTPDAPAYDTVTFDAPLEGRYVTLNITKAVDNAGGHTVVAMYEFAVMGRPLELEGFDVVAFYPQATSYADVGTPILALGLSQTVHAILQNGNVRSVKVNWNSADYRADVAGTYVLEGEIDASELAFVANPQGLTVKKTVVLDTLSQTGRTEYPLNDGWRFFKGTLASGHATSLDEQAFASVTLPHTWNAEDGADGGNNYYQGDGWYRRELSWRESFAENRVYLYFEGVSRECWVYVNGELIETHRGAYTAFYVDITDHLKKGNNLVAVRVNNKITEDLATQVGDFTQWGGIYRDVSLIVTGKAHIDTSDLGSNGLSMTTTDVSDRRATVTVRSKICNDSADETTVTLRYDLSIPADGSIEWIDEIPREWLPFDPADMSVPGGKIVYQTEKTITLGPGETYPFEHTFTVSNPHLWNGLADPFRYIGTLQLTCDGKTTDTVSDYIGFRSFTVDADSGAYLNGESYNLRGVSRHQDRAGMGSAITAKEHNEDFAMIYEMGANAVRLAHYPQADYFYDLCDQYGMIVWAENAFVNYVGGEGSYEQPDATRKAFADSVRTQLRELIRQQYNHPSIVVWCIQNEVQPENAAFMIPFCQELTDICHAEDPTRYVTQATANGSNSGWPSDLICTNLYPGWYYSDYSQLKSYIDRFRSSALGRPVGISEYGIGANFLHHCEGYPAIVCKADILYQYEEYQSEAHESFIAQINEMDYLWCTFVWNMFDFGADQRYEAQVSGINNKGLVSYDRTVRKDAFYLYKANWSDLPTLHLNSSRFLYRETDSIVVKAYANCDSVSLYVNGELIGTMTQAELDQPTVFMWQDIALKGGENKVKIVGTRDGKQYTDEVVWHYISIDSDVYTVNEGAMQLMLPTKQVYVQNISDDLLLNVDMAITVYAEDGVSIVTEGEMREGMTVKLAYGEIERTYAVVRDNLSLYGTASATMTQDGNDAANAIDGRENTYWSSYGSKEFPQSLQIDLGDVYDLAELRLLFYGAGRQYYYDVYVTDDAVLGGESGDEPMFRQLTGHGFMMAEGAAYDYDIITLPEGTRGRYVTITVTGCNQGGVTAAAIWEVGVYEVREKEGDDPEDQTKPDEPTKPDDPVKPNVPTTPEDPAKPQEPQEPQEPTGGCRSSVSGGIALVLVFTAFGLVRKRKEY